MKAYGGSSGTVPVILNLGTTWKRVVNFISRPLYLRDTSRVHIEQEAGWAPEPVWTLGEE